VKERLTGAIILVALIVLLVPELLTGPIRTKSAPAASHPATLAGHPEAPLRSYTLTLTAPPARQAFGLPAGQAPAEPAQSAAVAPAGASAESHLETSPTSQEPQPGAAAVTQPPASTPAAPQRSEGSGPALQGTKSAAHSSVREAGSSGGWVVQLGSFASRENANRLARSLTRKGFRMSVSPARAGSRTLWRVRAGPAHDRAGATRLAARLRGLGHRGQLLPLR
jgi:DedD protein